MFRLVVFCVACLTSSTLLYGQFDTIPYDHMVDSKGTVIGISDAEMIDQMMVVMPGIGSNSRQMLEEQSIKPYLMPPRSSGDFGSSRCYAIATALEYYVNFDRNFKVNLSPEYIFLNLPSDQVAKAFAFLVNNGTVSAAIMPYGASSISSGTHATPKFRIKNFLLIYRDEVRFRQKTYETRKALMRGNPVLVELKVPADFADLDGIREWEDAGRAGEEAIAYLLVVGYDETKEAFEVMGTFGSSWGRNGYLWIPFDEFGKRATNGFVIVPADDYDVLSP